MQGDTKRMTLSGKVVLVTGARGIGGASAKLLAARGAQVVVAYRQNQVAAEALIAEIVAASGRAEAIQCDVVTDAQVDALLATIQQRWGRVDILVSNAGGGWLEKPWAETSWQEYIGVVDRELKAAFGLTRAILPMMQAQRAGRLIYMASNLAERVLPKTVASSTAKAALLALVRNVAVEAGPFGITANAIMPGMVMTESNAYAPQAALEAIATRTPLRHIATPEEIAGVIAFFASEDSRFVTGTCLIVDGGMSLHV